ncbi:MAG: hypothetical protein U9O98_10395 [Asgard group archaeon]|nr:hypothetical protein [Asgard group archaeon]
MPIIEAGVMYEGILLVKNRYYDETEIDSFLTSSFLETIQKFGKEAFKDDTEFFRMKRYTIYLHKISLKKSKDLVTVYIICYSKDPEKVIRRIISKIANEFIKEYPVISHPETTRYKKFKEKMSSIIGDLRYKTEDRLKKVFT